jgi:aromatic-L-amino-acid decarboxylase
VSGLEPSGDELRALGEAVLEFAASFVDELPERPAVNPAPLAEALARSLEIGDRPRDLTTLLGTVRAAADLGIETAGPRYFGYIPAGGLPTSALGHLIALVLNRFPTVADLAPGMVAIEESVLGWLCREFDLPADTSGGVLMSGGSAATLTALVAAREDRLGEDLAGATLYVSPHTHLCVAKAARIAGLARDAVRTVPVDADLRMDPAAAADLIAADRRAGRRPFLLVGTAGTTDTGAVDPLGDLAALARREALWFHVDGAYGGAFQLTARGRERLAGIEAADSIVLDPHKGLFVPYGLGAVLARDVRTLTRAHSHHGAYLQDLGTATGLPDHSDRSLELTRDHRGLRLWLPLQLHGAAAFREALDEKLDLAAWAHEQLVADAAIEVPWRPQLSTVVFRAAAGDDATRSLFDAIRRDGRILLTSTTIDGRMHVRLCILSVRSHAEHVAQAVETIRSVADQAPGR